MMSKIIHKGAQSFGTICHEIFSFFCCLVGLIKVKLLFSKARHNMLEIGAGSSKKQGMITCDLDLQSDFPFDLSAGLPFPDESLDFIYAEHVLEHFTYRDIIALLYECKRAMKPGAVMKIAVPDARIYLEAYENPHEFDHKSYCSYGTNLDYQLRINPINYMFYMNGHHRHMFDEESLLSTLCSAGFDGVCSRDFDAGLDRQARQYESIYAQCVKK